MKMRTGQRQTKRYSKPPVMTFYEAAEDDSARVVGVPVFREGKYPQGNYSAADVEALATNYNPEILEAPLTPDHVPDGPAWGWFEKFYTVNTPNGKELYGDVKLLFIGEWMWKSGMYKRRSIEIYTEFELPSGETGLYPRAVSLLGAASPAVKGLANMFSAVPKESTLHGQPVFYSFADEDADTVKFAQVDYEEHANQADDDSEDGPNTIEVFNGVLEGLTGFLTQLGFTPGQPGLTDERDFNNMKTKPGAGTANNEPDANPAAPAQQVSMSVAEYEAFKAKETKLAEVEADKAAAEKRAADAEQRANTAEYRASLADETKRFNDALAANRDKVSPAQAARYLAVFQYLFSLDTEKKSIVSFSEKVGSKEVKRDVNPLDLVLECMSAGAKVIDLNPNPTTDNDAAIAAAASLSQRLPEPDSKAWADMRHDRALQLQKADPKAFANYATAASAAERELLAKRGGKAAPAEPEQAAGE